jgi:hypothetical protein
MSSANYYDLSGHSTRISWYPGGRGGPIHAGGQGGGPTLVYQCGAIEVSVSGDNLTVGPATPAGTFVVALIKKTGIVPGGVTSIGVLFPDMHIDSAPVPVHTIAVIAHHRGTSSLGAGQLETYTEMALTGTATNIKLPL